MQYYVEKPNTWRAANKKCAEIIEYVDKFHNCLIYDAVSLNKFIEDLRIKVEELNRKYPRTKRLIVKFQFNNFISCRPDKLCSSECEYVFTILLAPVKMYIGFPTQCVNCTSFNR